MHGAPGLGALDQAGSRQHVQMLDHGRQRHLETAGDLRHRQIIILCEPVEDRASRRVSQRSKRAIEFNVAKVNHVVKYASGCCGRQDGAFHNRVRASCLALGYDHAGAEADQRGNQPNRSNRRAVGLSSRMGFRPAT